MNDAAIVVALNAIVAAIEANIVAFSDANASAANNVVRLPEPRSA
jgi:hypothetical protein